MKASGVIVKILGLYCLTQACCAWRVYNDLRVKSNGFGLHKRNAFYKMPKNTHSRLMRSFVRVEPEAGFQFPMDFYCQPNDPRVCFMYDKKGHVAGAQVSILKSDVAHVDKEDYDYDSITEYTKTNFFNLPAYSGRVYFTNPEKLTERGRQNTSETAEGLFAYLDGKLVEIQREQPTGPKMGDFDIEGCFPAMGQHYIYNKNTSCNTQYALFPVYEQGGLVGYGFSTPAKASKYKIDWYEVPTSEAVKIILPNGSDCPAKAKYEYVSFHVFLVDRPWNIACPSST